MLPVILDPKALCIGMAGAGEGLQKRLDMLARAGAEPAAIFQDRLPSKADLAGLRLLFVAGLEYGPSQLLAEQARAAGVLVNVEDKPALCDFHVPAAIRRGDLLITVSTAGRSPGLARAVRTELEHRFGLEWEEHLNEIAALRSRLRAEGVLPADVSQATRAQLESKGWLS